MKRRHWHTGGGCWALTFAAAIGAMGCTDVPVGPDPDLVPQLAKGGGGKPGGGTPTSFPATWTVSDMGIASDGKGPYEDGSCGVAASLSLRSDGQWGSQMQPAARALSAAEAAACGGPRAMTLTLAVRHISDTPHVDDVTSPLGTVDVDMAAFVLDSGIGKVNPKGATCFNVGRNGRVTGAGLRFDPVGYPGSSSLEMTRTASGGYILQSRPWPDNLAFCEDNDGVSFWHVTLALDVAPAN